MKTLSALVLLALICFLHRSSAGPAGFGMFKICCERYTKNPIPKSKVKHVMETSTDCPTKAVVVTSVCDEQYCIDPESRWAKRVLREYQKSPGAPFNSSKCDEPKKTQ